MVTFPPLSPSITWMNSYMKALCDTSTEDSALTRANLSLPSPRDFGRYSILDTSGNILTLSLAVEGGARQLRNPDKIGLLKLSEHGDWRKNHLGALEACLGRKPFYPYFIHRIQEVYSNRDLQTLRDFNSAIFRVIYSFLIEDIRPDILRSFADKPVVTDRGREIADTFVTEISVLEYMAIFGKETLTGIMAMN